MCFLVGVHTAKLLWYDTAGWQLGELCCVGEILEPEGGSVGKGFTGAVQQKTERQLHKLHAVRVMCYGSVRLTIGQQ